MINNFQITKIWKKLLLLIVILFSITFLYSKVYISFHGFPAESIAYSAKLSKLSLANCLDSSISENIKSKPINAPYLPLVGIDEFTINLINQSNIALFFNQKMYFLDSIGKDDLALAFGALRSADKLSSIELEEVIDGVNNFYETCNKYLNSDYGITELYWAGKGTSILHHWAYLYDGSLLTGSRKAQYGNAVPLIAGFASQIINGKNYVVDNFVKVSIFLFYICAIIYILLFWIIFKKYADFYQIGTILLLKIYLFINLGVFALLLSPGYHWFRDLACLIIFLAYINFYNKNFKIKFLSIFLILLSFSIDPAFSTISFLSLILSEIFWNLKLLRQKFFLIIPLAILLLLSFYFQRNNLFNLYNSIPEVYSIYTSSSTYNPYVLLILFSCVAMIVMNIFFKFDKLYNFFPCFTLLSSLYYFTNPDRHHFIKYLEYSIPTFFVFIVILLKLYNLICKDKLYLALKNINAKLIIYNNNFYNNLTNFLPIRLSPLTTNLFYLLLIFFLTFTTIKKINQLSPDWILRAVEANGESFYSTKNFLINDRSINANLSPELYSHLTNFPDDWNYDFLVSRNDKYILFLYDKKNNLGNIDLLATINDQMVNRYLSKFKSKKSIVIIDENNLNIDSLAEFKSNHPILSKATAVANLQLKKQFYLYRLTDLIKSECTLIQSVSGWSSYECN